MFIDRFDALGIRSNHLSDLVAKLSLVHANNITAGGIETQFKYLNTVGNWPFYKILTSALRKALKPGRIVIVDDSQNRGVGSINSVVGLFEGFDNFGKIIRIACKVGGIREFSLRKIVRVCDIKDSIHAISTLEDNTSIYERLIMLGLEPSDLHSMVVQTALDKAVEFNDFGLELQVDFLRLVCAMNDVDILLEALLVAKGTDIDIEISSDQPIVGRLHDVNTQKKRLTVHLPDNIYTDYSIDSFVRIVYE